MSTPDNQPSLLDMQIEAGKVYMAARRQYGEERVVEAMQQARGERIQEQGGLAQSKTDQIRGRVADLHVALARLAGPDAAPEQENHHGQ